MLNLRLFLEEIMAEGTEMLRVTPCESSSWQNYSRVWGSRPLKCNRTDHSRDHSEGNTKLEQPFADLAITFNSLDSVALHMLEIVFKRYQMFEPQKDYICGLVSKSR